MDFKLHNKAIIKTNNKSIEVYNQVNNPILECLSKLKSYNNFISIKTYNDIDNNSLEKPISLKTTNIYYQSNIEDGELFSKSETIINTNSLNDNYLTEIGYSDGNILNPTFYNTFILTNEENPNGLYIKDSEEISIEIYMYLYINENNFLTLGKNKFIEFLLGAGLNEIYYCKGSNYSSNENIYRELPENNQIYPCNIDIHLEENNLTINLNSDISTGEINEILFISSNSVFARYNTKEIKPTIQTSIEIQPKTNYILDIKEDIKNINSIKNLDNSSLENEYYVSNYANNFGDKISTPFNKMFDNNTKRFLSKDGDKIFFLIDENIYGYSNKDFSIKSLNTNTIKAEYIIKLISFDDYIFIITKLEPYILCYKIINNAAILINNNLTNNNNINLIANSRNVDIVLSKNNIFMLGFISDEGKGYTIYFSLQNDMFIYNDIKISDYNFPYLVAVHKNNFCDAQIIYLQAGETSLDSRIVYHYPDKTESDVYSALAYNFTNNTKNIYAKNRAIIVEKINTNNLLIYYLPQVYKYELDLFSSETISYISQDGKYLIQKLNNNEYNIYNLIGYDTPELFINNLPAEINKNEIVDFEFLKDSLLIFLNNNKNPIVAYNLNLNKTQIENVTSNTSTYKVEMEKYDKLGLNNEGVVVTITTNITLWFFQIKYIN